MQLIFHGLVITTNAACTATSRATLNVTQIAKMHSGISPVLHPPHAPCSRPQVCRHSKLTCVHVPTVARSALGAGHIMSKCWAGALSYASGADCRRSSSSIKLLQGSVAQVRMGADGSSRTNAQPPRVLGG